MRERNKKGRAMRFLLNSAVITDFGTYQYTQLTAEQARSWYKAGPVTSTIGYQETADALAELLGEPVAVNRLTVKMQPGDEALVFRIVLPLGYPRTDLRDKGQIRNVIQAGFWELGLLKRIA
jgi:hypothetical protein